MYFINQEHEKNFYGLKEFYGPGKSKDLQYQSNFYIAAVPDLFDLLDKQQIKRATGSPMSSLIDYSEKKRGLIPVHEGLTGSTTQLLEIALSLFNGHLCSLDRKPSKEFGEVILQAIKIRYDLRES